MPPKRPAPLSDAALSKRDAGGAAAAPAAADAAAAAADATGASGETHTGVHLLVKNTFIDGTGLTPKESLSKKDLGLRTAPAQVNAAAGFVQRAMLASMLETPLEAPPATEPAEAEEYGTENGEASDEPGELYSKGPLGVVQRPASGMDWPMMTPSPTHASMFSSARYQLFGGPAPLQEATYGALGPSQRWPGGSEVLSTAAPVASQQHVAVSRQPLSYGTSNFATAPGPAASAPAASVAPAASSAAPAVAPALPARPAAEASAGPPPPPAMAPGEKVAARAATSPPKGKVQDGDDEDDEDDVSDHEGQQQQHPTRSPEDAPKPPPGAEHPSIGSANHAEGTCKRCCFFPRNRCNNGYECDFCHYEHEKRKRKNKKSKKKNKDKAAAAEAEAAAAAGAAAAEGADLTGGALGSAEDVWSTSYGAHGAQVGLPPVMYEGTDGSEQWTYQWVDDPRSFFGQFLEPPYYPGGSALVGTTPQRIPNDPAIGLQPVQPLYAQPSYAAHWPPYPAPSYPALSAEDRDAPTASHSGDADGCAPPPTEAPRLPRGVQKGLDMGPPPEASPTLPPAVDTTFDEEGKPPPPASSPKFKLLMPVDEKPPPTGDPALYI